MVRYTTDRARPGLVALYDIRPGNGTGQFLQPRSPHGACHSSRCVSHCCHTYSHWCYHSTDSMSYLPFTLLSCCLACSTSVLPSTALSRHHLNQSFSIALNSSPNHWSVIYRSCNWHTSSICAWATDVSPIRRRAVWCNHSFLADADDTQELVVCLFGWCLTTLSAQTRYIMP